MAREKQGMPQKWAFTGEVAGALGLAFVAAHAAREKDSRRPTHPEQLGELKVNNEMD
jgi:hypothetical protein